VRGAQRLTDDCHEISYNDLSSSQLTIQLKYGVMNSIKSSLSFVVSSVLPTTLSVQRQANKEASI
jgi:hypothetical protein